MTGALSGIHHHEDQKIEARQLPKSKKKHASDSMMRISPPSSHG
jgi:hypothetical protein